MKFYTSIPKRLKPYYKTELKITELNAQAEISKVRGIVWNELIMGQKYPFVHWKMLQFGIKIKNVKEIIEQIPRLFFGGVKSFVGTIPAENAGGANVDPLFSALSTCFMKLVD